MFIRGGWHCPGFLCLFRGGIDTGIYGLYTGPELYLDNCGSPLKEGEIKMDDTIVLLEFVDVWLETFKKNTVKAASYERLKVSRKSLEQYEIAKKPIGEITFFDIQRYVNDLVQNGYSMSGVKKQLRIVTAPLKQAAAIRLIKADPSIGVRLPAETNVQKQKKNIEAYTEKEQKKIYELVRTSLTNVGYLGVIFMIETGLRSGELLALKWKDIEMEKSKMHVHATIVFPMNNKKAFYQDSPKSRASNRLVPLTAKAMAVLKILKEQRETEWVFEQDKTRYSYKQLMYQTKKLCREAKVTYYGEHAFRHTFATNCFYKGINVKILSRLMGHSSVQVTYNTYIHLYGDGFDEMYAALCL